MARAHLKEVMPTLLGAKSVTRFFIDTCFALDEDAFAQLNGGFFENLKVIGNPPILAQSVLHELRKQERKQNDQDLSSRAKKALTRIAELDKSHHIKILGEQDETFADQTFLKVFARFRLKYNLLLFTQDKGLARDLLRMNDIESATHMQNRIRVARYTGAQGIFVYERIEDFEPARQRISPVNLLPANPTSVSPRSTPLPRRNTLFRSFAKPRHLDDQIIGDGKVYRTDSKVYISGRQEVRLGVQIASGGEGDIFEISATCIAKIYFHDRRTRFREEKLKLMCSRQLNVPSVMWPFDIVSDEAGNFLGYIMLKAKGKPMQHCVFGKTALAQHFPVWDRKNLIQLARTYASTVAAVHQAGLLVGDINPMNALVVSATEIHLVDVDSFQVEDFPCPVGMANFRAPEIPVANYSSFLRTERHETFALASLIFMILMGGKSPYSFQGGGDPAENIRSGNFPYANNYGAVPAGAYRYIWSFFPNYIQRAFVDTFAEPNKEYGRPTAEAWVELLDHYLRDLARETPDSGAYSLWPVSFKMWKSDDIVQLKCESCDTSFQTTTADAAKRRQHPQVFCGNCVTALMLAKKASATNVNCSGCSRPTPLPFGASELDRRFCDDCTAREASVRRTCKVCNGSFSIPATEVSFFWKKGLQLPKKCESCRKAQGSSTRRGNTRSNPDRY